MKNKIKLSSLMIAACMSVGMAVPLNLGSTTADAATWKCGDVDNDGQVTMMDQVRLNQYLIGMIELTDYTKADTNADCMVDIVDSNILRMRLAEQVSSLPCTTYGGGSQYANVSTQSVNESRGYTTFDAKTGEGKNGYFLDPNPVVDNSREVIGDEDSRYRDDSLPGVVKIIDNYSINTGFVIDAHTIATAAHCVYGGLEQFESNKQLKKILILDNSGNVEKTITNIYETHVPNKYIVNMMVYNNTSKSDEVRGEHFQIAHAYDYALITVEEDLSEYACFDLGIPTDGMMSDSQKLYCTGFPAYIKDGKHPDAVNNFTKHERFTGEGFMKPDANEPFPEREIYYDIDTYGGNSGGPVYVKNTIGNTTYYTVIGIHTRYIDENNDKVYEMNSGTQMTTELLHFYKNNPYIE